MVVNASLPMKSLTDKVFYVRSDHARFWFPQQSPEATMTSLDAIWLTDTCEFVMFSQGGGAQAIKY